MSNQNSYESASDDVLKLIGWIIAILVGLAMLFVVPGAFEMIGVLIGIGSVIGAIFVIGVVVWLIYSSVKKK